MGFSGPIVFKQTRVGAKPVRDGERMYWRRHDFTFYKFRSMKHNSDVNLHKEFVQAYIAGDDNKMREIQPDKNGADMLQAQRRSACGAGGRLLAQNEPRRSCPSFGMC
ncbi:MAG: sugar transferase [Caldilineaceae bacterium]